MTKLILSGANGRMGKAIQALVEGNSNFEIVAGIDKHNSNSQFPIFPAPQSLDITTDAIIDFSNPEALVGLLDLAVAKQIPLVLATTGYTSEQQKNILEASEKTAIFQSANMSLGINLLAELCKKANQILGTDYDIEIIEKHHNQKLDSPSGTAILLADEINSQCEDKYEYEYNRSNKREKRPKTQIGIHGVRGGSIVGEHEVLFAGPDEVISLSHIAYSRTVFANGALKAAQFLKGKPAGLYSMKNII